MSFIIELNTRGQNGESSKELAKKAGLPSNNHLKNEGSKKYGSTEEFLKASRRKRFERAIHRIDTKASWKPTDPDAIETASLDELLRQIESRKTKPTPYEPSDAELKKIDADTRAGLKRFEQLQKEQNGIRSKAHTVEVFNKICAERIFRLAPEEIIPAIYKLAEKISTSKCPELKLAKAIKLEIAIIKNRHKLPTQSDVKKIVRDIEDLIFNKINNEHKDEDSKIAA